MRNLNLLKRPFILFLIAVAPLCTQPLQAAPAAAGSDPSIGSYFYYAALSPRCGGSRTRRIALASYKEQFLTMLRKAGAANPADLQKHRQYIDALERREPNAAELAPFNAMFAKSTPGDIAQLCQNFEASVAQRMKLNETSNTPQAGGAAKAPIRYYSLQHLHALMVSCEQADPVPAQVAARAAAFARAIPRVHTANGLYRTEVGVDGKVKETDFPSAALMVKSPEFDVDSKRYLAVVERRSKSALQGDCKEFVSLMDGVGKR
jgi:hypothetical protein